ncbi:MAG: hypothetical protein IKF78_13910 [Atopobiaceae bacterium]|nr:hypothetical protein [Atopobiaceae bacterium]
MRYHIFDPTGNITALVSDSVSPESQPRIAARIMELHPEVEQVGFVRSPGTSPSDSSPGTDADLSLRMAGGEFCGNATMCAAVYYAMRQNVCPSSVSLIVSGATSPLEVLLHETDEGLYATSVHMPPVLEIKTIRLTHGNSQDMLPIVCMEGISHVVICKDSPLFELLHNRNDAEHAVRAWCEQVGAEGLGIQFLVATSGAHLLTPLVYVPASNTTYWENSCASGSAAVAAYLGMQAQTPVDVTLREPGGTIRVLADYPANSIELHGHVRPLDSHLI